MPIELIKAKPKDASVLAQMNLRLIQDEGHRNPMTLNQLTQRMRKWLHGKYSTYLFLKDEQVFGYCRFVKKDEFVYIAHFFIERGFRRAGLGKQTIELLRKRFWKNERRLRLDVLITNRRGIKFWRSVGFKDYSLTMEL